MIPRDRGFLFSPRIAGFEDISSKIRGHDRRSSNLWGIGFESNLNFLDRKEDRSSTEYN
jgi:hypothetical protein